MVRNILILILDYEKSISILRFYKSFNIIKDQDFVDLLIAILMIKQFDWINGKRILKKILSSSKDENILKQTKTVISIILFRYWGFVIMFVGKC